LLPAPAATSTFPTLFPRICPALPEPLPRRVPLSASAWFFLNVYGLPKKRRFGQLLAWFRERDFPRVCFRGCSYFVMLPGRAVARTGLRMMPTSPPLPLKSRTVSFPQYGFKAGMSDGAFPAPTRSSRPLVCHRPSCSPLASSVPRSVPRDETRWNTSVRATSAALPQGPSLRSGL